MHIFQALGSNFPASTTHGTPKLNQNDPLPSRDTKLGSFPAEHCAASFSTALRYLSEYCEFHKVTEQSHAALAAALLLPVARYHNRMVHLPTPRVRRKKRFNVEGICTTPAQSEIINELDRLLTLSCNAVGTKALLSRSFLNPMCPVTSAGHGCKVPSHFSTPISCRTSITSCVF